MCAENSAFARAGLSLVLCFLLFLLGLLLLGLWQSLRCFVNSGLLRLMVCGLLNCSGRVLVGVVHGFSAHCVI